MDNQGLLKRLKITSEILGTGGFARVVKAEFDGNQVALKLLLPQWTDPSNARCRAFQGHFIREAKFLERQSHPNVVKCMGLVQLAPNHPGMPSGYSWPAFGMILELGRGGSVAKQVYAQMVQVHSRLYTDHDALKWMRDVAEALRFLHTLPKPVVHRDMKLENMLIFKEPVPPEQGGGFKTKIKMADFGLHAELDTTRTSVLRRRTRSGAAGLPKALSLRPCDMRIEEEPSSPPRAADKAITPTPPPHMQDATPFIESMSGAEDVSVRGQQPQPVPLRSKLKLSVKPPMLDVRPPSGQISSTAICVEAHVSLGQGVAYDCVPRASIDGRQSSPSPPKSPKDGSSQVTQLRAEPISVGGIGVATQPIMPGGLPPQGSISAQVSENSDVQGRSGEIKKRQSESGGWAMDRYTSGPVVLGTFDRPSVVSDVIKRALAQEYEKAYKMTGETGSAIYMSPEVQRHEPYNEKTDIYSFGVMMYEVFARQMIVTTAVAADPDAYAIHVSNGFREPKPDKMDPELFKLIDWCRSHDPNERPNINDVIACLDLLGESLVDSGPVSEGCGCIIS